PAGTAYSGGQLSTSGGTGPYTYTQSSGSPEVTVSSSGAVSAPGTLPVGSYPATGTVTDSLGDTANWTFTLTVSAVPISQAAPTSGTTTSFASSGFTDQLATTGALGPVSFSPGSSTPSGLAVSSSGVVSTTGTLSPNTYTISGTDSDAFGDKGTWSFALTVTATTIKQGAPTSNSTTPANSSSFTQQLKTSSNTGSVTFVTTGSSPPGLVVSSSGVVSTKSRLPVGTYTVSGTDSDGFGDKGTWSFTLKVSSSAITQVAPFSNAKPITPATSASFTDQLKTTGNAGSVKFVATGSGSTPPGVVVSSSGAVSTKQALAVGTYTISGTDSDSLHDAGSWSFTLTVTAARITQAAPAAATTTTGRAFADHLKVSGSYGVDTYTQSSGAPDLKVSSSGVVSAPPSLRAGTYKATGTVSDAYRDVRGTWTFTLKVAATKVTQAAPAAGTTTSGKAFTDQLKVLGSHGTVTYAQSAGAPDLKVSSSGVVSASAKLPAGTYKATGTDSDSFGDTGSWSFTLTVGASRLTQIAPTSAQSATGTAFTAQLRFTGSRGSVICTQTAGAPDLKVSPSGVVSAPANLPAGTYAAAGTARDAHGDTGSWSFTLTVGASRLTQIAPTSARTTIGTAFTAQLRFTGSRGAVIYAQSAGAPDLKVSPSGVISAPANLPAGIYKAGGTARDAHGDIGSWSFTLTVAATRITQVLPVAGTTPVGTAFTAQLKFSDSHGTVTYAQSSGAPDLKVSPSGAVSSSANLPAGTYKAGGTARDASGDVGSWSFSLTVKANKLTQAAPATGTTTVGTAFTAQLKVSGSLGAVTYTQSAGAPQLTVSSSGAVSATAKLPAGTYKATGSASDAYGDRGSWSFSLTVKANKLTQAAPAAGTTAVGTAFTAQLKVSGSLGAVTYTQSAGAPQLKVSSSGAVSAPARLPAGTYKATGSANDAYGDVGGWSFSLTVKANKLAETGQTKGTTAVGRAFTAQLKVSGSLGAVTYTQSAGAPDLKVSSSGAVSAPPRLPAGTYKATGSASDAYGDIGSWNFSLTVKANKLTQIGQTTGTTTTGKAFVSQLKVSGSLGAVTYSQSAGAPQLNVSSSGAVSAPASLPAGTYKATGATRDILGDTGGWSFSLTVTASKLTQIAPSTAKTTTDKAFTDQLAVSGSKGAVTYTESAGAPHLTVSSSGKVSGPDTLPAGTYKATGTARDSLGDSGTWSFSLTVKATTLKQAGPLTATVAAGTAFTTQLKFAGSHVKVTFVRTSGAQTMTVSSSGKVSAPDTLAPGTYEVIGTAKDGLGDTGTWTFTLTIEAP
ncbi:MAG: beta strand repeat-containing protein, partial [Acidimicrobiales bacterium]